jgi:hypothetical protein
MGQIADYVIALLDEIVGKPCEREKRYDWALGDESAKTGRRAMLPFDAVWESRKLIAEVDEDQHRQSTTSTRRSWRSRPRRARRRPRRGCRWRSGSSAHRSSRRYDECSRAFR